jgi:uncharacterized protein YjbI with pentapeptide repeats
MTGERTIQVLRLILKGANLQGANLQGANLQGADLRNANLWGACFQGANLIGTKIYYSYTSKNILHLRFVIVS